MQKPVGGGQRNATMLITSIDIRDKEFKPLATFATIKVGKALNIEDLQKKPSPRGRRANPRDEDLLRLVNEVSVGPASRVLPWHFEGKAATARAAAIKVIKSSAANVYVSSRLDMPGVLLFSRVRLSGRQDRQAAS